jgi:hypothetical protein
VGSLAFHRRSPAESTARWEEYLRQHAGRLTELDRAVEEVALAFSDPPAYADHLLPP